MDYFLKDVTIATQLSLQTTNLLIRGDRIVEIGSAQPDSSKTTIIDCNENLCLPGFIDVHVHGSYGINFMQAEPEKVLQLADRFAENGLTAFLATTAGSSIDDIKDNCRAISSAMTQQKSGARIMGIHIEGPFFNNSSPARGANNPAWLRPPDAREAEELLEACDGNLRLFDIAPELPDAKSVVDLMLNQDVTVAAAHTDATYEQACRGFDWGINHLIHTYNGMRRIHHREPGVVIAAMLDDRVWLEVIADGQHVHPEMIKLLYRLKGIEGMGAVTDATMLAGLPPGEYDFIGTNVVLEEQRAYLKEQGTLAGSVATGLDLFNNLRSWGFSTYDASVICSSSPARHMGWDDIGTINVDKKADLLLLDEEGVNLTFVDGQIAYRNESFQVG